MMAGDCDLTFSMPEKNFKWEIGGIQTHVRCITHYVILQGTYTLINDIWSDTYI